MLYRYHCGLFVMTILMFFISNYSWILLIRYSYLILLLFIISYIFGTGGFGVFTTAFLSSFVSSWMFDCWLVLCFELMMSLWRSWSFCKTICANVIFRPKFYSQSALLFNSNGISEPKPLKMTVRIKTVIQTTYHLIPLPNLCRFTFGHLDWLFQEIRFLEIRPVWLGGAYRKK